MHQWADMTPSLYVYTTIPMSAVHRGRFLNI